MPRSRFVLLECDGVGIAVEGTPWSVGLVLGDAQRHGEPLAWFKGAAGDLVGVDPGVAWETAEVDHAGG